MTRPAYYKASDFLAMVPPTVPGSASKQSAASEIVNVKTLERLRDALTHIPADDRDVWQRMGHALKTAHDGYELFMVWSATSDKFDAADAERAWESFKPNRTSVGAVFAEAKRHGWTPHAGVDDVTALDLLDLATTDPQPPQFKVEGLIPERAVTLLAAHGGAGKSHLALHMAVCLAAGVPFFGVPVKQSAVVFYSCEDDVKVLHWRLNRICGALGVPLASLHGRLFIYDMTGAANALFAENLIDPTACLTARYGWLSQRCEGIDVAIIDNASDTFDANENARAKVRQFVQSLVRLVRERDGAVLLLSHIDKNSAKFKSTEGETYSGSTAWHNSVRSRLLLAEKDGGLILSHGKSNYGAKAAAIALRWTPGVTLELAPEVVADGNADGAAVLALIAEFASRGERISTATNSPANASKKIGKELGYPKHLNRADLFTLLRDLERQNFLAREVITTTDRKTREVWRVTPAGQSAPSAPSAPTPIDGTDSAGEHCALRQVRQLAHRGVGRQRAHRLGAKPTRRAGKIPKY